MKQFAIIGQRNEIYAGLLAICGQQYYLSVILCHSISFTCNNIDSHRGTIDEFCRKNCEYKRLKYLLRTNIIDWTDWPIACNFKTIRTASSCELSKKWCHHNQYWFTVVYAFHIHGKKTKNQASRQSTERFLENVSFNGSSF